MNEPVTSGKIEVQQANTCFKIYCYFFLPFLYITFSSCSGKQPLFTLLSSSTTGVDFKNELTVSDSLNIMNYIYLYNGGGVATGDINNDGLADIYFTSNQGDNKLFLNKGHLQFEDITAIAGVKGEGNWKTGVTMADVNGDGWLDIYVCAVGGYEGMIGRNQLYINNGKLGFSDEAAGYGLNEEGFNTQSTFLDYDKDGDLDVFIVKHAVHSTEKYSDTASRHIPDAASGDKLFRNETSNGKNFFVDVTAAAGIFNGRIGYGLNAIVNDFNNDGWPDIYVSNDFNEEDYYYLNNGNGSFSELNKQAFGHESHFSMGSDAADINNDGWVDLVTLDMLPADEKILKSSMPHDPLEIYQYKLGFGYQAQCSRNCLQLNRGAGRRFSDIALFSGIAATDWSWSPLLADFDNDGICDLFITNGIYRRPNDLDFMNYYAHTPEAYDATKKKLNDSAFNLMPPGMQSNYLFRGTSSLKFSEVSKAEGFSKQGFSNGAAYADFDNDGDLDLVLNNLNGYADIYRNNTNAIRRTNYISIQLKGNKKNKAGLGAAFELSAGSEKFHRYQTATRGFQSSSSGNVVIGLGNHQVIDTLRVTWPDSSGTVQEWYHVKTNQRITLQQDSASHEKNKVVFDQPLFTPIKNMEGIDFVHKENFFNDFAVQPLILHGVSTEGPKLAVGDVNGDGLDDFYACGAAAQAGALYIQDASGGFKKSNTLLFESDRLCEDVNAVFFDADNDKDPDLYVVSGGNEWEGNDFRLVDRLYVNDGAGLFTRSPGLPLYFGNKSVAAPGDIDKDGDMDLFVGGRVVAGKYGETPRSYLLVNDGKGKFTIETRNLCADLENIGMVTDAVWSDVNKDGWLDLVIAGEWMPVTVLLNKKGQLTNVTEELGLSEFTGLWISLKMADINNDGLDDILVGNLGENSKLPASKKFPLVMYLGDFDNNTYPEQILSSEKNGLYYPFLGKDELQKVVPGVIRKRYPDYKMFAGQTVEEIFEGQLRKSKKLAAATLSSMVFVNRNGKYQPIDLPGEIQWAPVYCWFTGDLNQNGLSDILAGGNLKNVPPYEGSYDAGYGTLLEGKGNRVFTAMTMLKSGIDIKGQVRDIKSIRMAKGRRVLAVALNNDKIKFFE